MRVYYGVLLLGGLAAAGCGTPASDGPAADAPLTVEQWKALPPDTKYEIDTLERLRQGSPQFREQREWDRFTRQVLLPAKKKDRPVDR